MKRVTLALFLIVGTFVRAEAGELSHYAGGFHNIRDFMMPRDSGLYLSSYNFYYQSGRLNDEGGHEIPIPGSDPALFPDIDVYMMAVPILFVQKQALKKVLQPFTDKGDRVDYAFMIAPTFGNSSISASLSIDDQNSQPITSQFGFGDLFVQPLWLGFAPIEAYKDRFQFSLSWGFYAPTGKYDTDPLGPGRAPDPDNIGAGFWTNQFRGATQLNPFGPDWAAIVLAATYEVNSEKDDLDITPGDHFTLNWGVSQFLPTGLGNWLLEVGPTGYNSWQVTLDRGAGRSEVHDEVHAAGFQLGLTEATCLSVVNFHYFYEYESEDRFAGHVIGLSFALHFPSSTPFRLRGFGAPACSGPCDETTIGRES